MRQKLCGLFGAFLVASLAACGNASDAGAPASAPPAAKGPQVELTVFAAASLREACGDLTAAFEKEHDAKLTFNFGASNALAQQVVAAQKGDVFVSADEAQMDVVEQAKLVTDGTRSQLLSNQLVVVQPKPRPSGVAAASSADALADESLSKLALANPAAVPAGKYARAWLEKRGLWSKLEARVVPGVDVRAALAAVESGAAQVGIVYATDAALSDKVEVTYRVPADEGPKISYLAAALSCSANGEQARAFVDFLHGAQARKVFEQRGFIVVPSARSGVDADVGY